MLKNTLKRLARPFKNTKGGDNEVKIGEKTWSLGTFAVIIVISAIVIGFAIVLFNKFSNTTSDNFEKLQNAAGQDVDIPVPQNP